MKQEELKIKRLLLPKLTFLKMKTHMDIIPREFLFLELKV